jgi:hypothetical protein
LLKISIQDDPVSATLKFEGKLVGPWVSELDRVRWNLQPSLGAKKVFLDICGMTFMDRKGTKALRKIFRLANAEILADTPLTRQFAANAIGRHRRTSNGKEICNA